MYYGDNTNIINYYFETQREYDAEMGAYAAYLQTKLNNLQMIQQEKIKKIMDKKKNISGLFNNTPFHLNISDIAQAATSSLGQMDVEQELEGLYQAVSSSMESVGQASDQYANSLNNLLIIKNEMAEGMTYTIENYSDIPSFEKIIANGMTQKGKLSNLIGILGQQTSSLAGAAIAQTVVKELSEQLNISSDKMTISSQYTEKGNERIGSYRLQTDNALDISISIDGVEGVLNLSFNISDKANLGLGKLTKKKTTGSLKFRDSTVAVTTSDLNDIDKYNTISYHWIGEKNRRVSGMWTQAGNIMRHYVGYRMLCDMVIKSQEFNDSIDFTVYGGNIIPEESVIEKLLSIRNSGKNYQYAADIEYYKLVSGNQSVVSSEKEAIKAINKLRTSIRTSLQI